ncbi:unnamed protein product [Closterium sp. NIES-65]|nr:unnamed protein product [Closterium sp. NIES-65]
MSPMGDGKSSEVHVRREVLLQKQQNSLLSSSPSPSPRFPFLSPPIHLPTPHLISPPTGRFCEEQGRKMHREGAGTEKMHLTITIALSSLSVLVGGLSSPCLLLSCASSPPPSHAPPVRSLVQMRRARWERRVGGVVCEDRVPAVADRVVLHKLAQDMREWPRLQVSD